MKSKIIMIICILATAFCAGLAGVSLLAPLDSSKSTSIATDRLIGVFITQSSLAELGAEYTDRKIYASVSEDTDNSDSFLVSFTGIDGISLFSYEAGQGNDAYNMTVIDGPITAGGTKYTVTDSGSKVAISGTVYVAKDSINHILYFNPVYETADKAVYMTDGQGASISFGTANWSINEASVQEQNGQNEDYEIDISIDMTLLTPPDTYTVLQFDKNNTMLLSETYSPDAFPDEYTPSPECSYLIVESYVQAEDGSMVPDRSLYQRYIPDYIDTDNQSSYILTFSRLDNGLCPEKSTTIYWK